MTLKSNPHKGFYIFLIVAVGIFLLMFLFLPGNNFFNWMRAKAEIRRQERQIELYLDKMKDLDHEMDVLSNDRDSLERFAREQYQYAAPGDDVYIIEE